MFYGPSERLQSIYIQKSNNTQRFVNMMKTIDIIYTRQCKQMKITVVLVKKYSKHSIIDENYHGWNIVDTV